MKRTFLSVFRRTLVRTITWGLGCFAARAHYFMYEGVKHPKCLNYRTRPEKNSDFQCDIPLVNQDVALATKSNRTFSHMTSRKSFPESHYSLTDTDAPNSLGSDDDEYVLQGVKRTSVF